MNPANPVIASYLEKVKDLTILPPVLLNVLAMNDDNELHFKKLELMIESDQILVTRLLRLANSPFYARGAKQPVQSVLQTITRLGFRTVRSLVALAFADSIFSTGNYAKFRKEVWEHSIATGIFAQFLCNDIGIKKQEDTALLGGLLHDLGKIVLNTIDRKLYIETLTRFLDGDRDIREIERELFKTDHDEIGAAAAEMWGLPLEILDVLKRRREEIASQPVHVQLISFSDLFARRSGYGRWLDAAEDRYNDYLQYFGLESRRESELRQSYVRRLQEHELYRFSNTL